MSICFIVDHVNYGTRYNVMIIRCTGMSDFSFITISTNYNTIDNNNYTYWRCSLPQGTVVLYGCGGHILVVVTGTLVTNQCYLQVLNLFRVCLLKCLWFMG